MKFSIWSDYSKFNPLQISFQLTSLKCNNVIHTLAGKKINNTTLAAKVMSIFITGITRHIKEITILNCNVAGFNSGYRLANKVKMKFQWCTLLQIHHSCCSCDADTNDGELHQLYFLAVLSNQWLFLLTLFAILVNFKIWIFVLTICTKFGSHCDFAKLGNYYVVNTTGNVPFRIF